MTAQHLHLMINAEVDRYWTADPTDALSIAFAEHDVAEWLNDLVSKIGMKAVFPARAAYVRAEGNEGITASINIETSHIAFHIWDATSPAKIQFDLYTCGDLDVTEVLPLLDEAFKFSSGGWMLIDREEGFVLKASGSFPL